MDGGYGLDREVRLDGWCIGGIVLQRDDGEGCATIREGYNGVASLGANVND